MTTEHETSSPSRCSEFPPWVLLDTVVRVRRCENETTAHATNSAGRPINMSFEVVDPPGLSHCVIDCPDLTEDEPTACVSGADGAFLLMRVFFPERDGRQMFDDVFVYKAGPGGAAVALPSTATLPGSPSFQACRRLVLRRRRRALLGRVARICVTSLIPPKCSPSQETRWPGLISRSVFCCAKMLTRTLRCC